MSCGLIWSANDESVFAIGKYAKTVRGLLRTFNCGEVGLEVPFFSVAVSRVLPDVGGLEFGAAFSFESCIHPVDSRTIASGTCCEVVRHRTKIFVACEPCAAYELSVFWVREFV